MSLPGIIRQTHKSPGQIAVVVVATYICSLGRGLGILSPAGHHNGVDLVCYGQRNCHVHKWWVNCDEPASWRTFTFLIDSYVISARVWLYRDLTSDPFVQYLAWVSLPVSLILFSAGFVHLLAPQSIGKCHWVRLFNAECWMSICAWNILQALAFPKWKLYCAALLWKSI